MTAYGQSDLTGTDVTWFHVDRTVCDDDGCMCELPTSEQVKARKRASRRGEWFVIHGGKTGQGTVPKGPYSEAEARGVLDRAMAAGYHRAKLLRVVEDYT